MVNIKVQDRILVAGAFTLYHLLERDSSFELDFLGYDQNSFFRNKILKWGRLYTNIPLKNIITLIDRILEII